MATPKLFEPISFRSVTARNRIAIAPMCQYSANDGLGDDWHIQHLGARAAGGAGMVIAEATHVSAVGRITPHCLGLWNPAHVHLASRLAAVIAMMGAVPGIQLSHAGRKASVEVPWRGNGPIPLDAGGWQPVAPTEAPFGEAHNVPHALSVSEVQEVIGQFAASARMAREAGFKVIELHGAHGYLGHQFISPICNTRNDQYGGDLRGRAKFLMDQIDAVRAEWPDELPLFVRLSCVDHMAGGVTLEDTVTLCRWLQATGKVDLIDCSSGGILAKGPQIPSLHPGYQVPYAETVRREAGIATGAVGLITEGSHAAEIVANGRADLVLVARAALANPAWPNQVAKQLGVAPALMPQYMRAH